MTCLRLVPWPWSSQPLCPFANLAAPEPACAMLPAVTAASASASASAPAIFRRLLILSSSSVTGETYALSSENGSPSDIEVVKAWKRLGLGPDEAHPFVHLLECGLGGSPGLVRTAGEEGEELGLVGPELLEARLNRIEERDEGLGDVGLERPVAAAVVASL